ncbi:MAG: DUF1572 domain-containing protein [Saprospiraceae bacterium]|nr:DUF1572 domain-containing protein [Saprospiraceae bacterium]
MSTTLADNFLESSRRLFRYYKGLGDKAMAQVDDEALMHQPDPESNSIALIVKHMSGNMLSRWTDFLTSDGEKTWRQRDQEFEGSYADREALLEAWEKGWQCLFDAVDPLTAADIERIVYIRNEGHTVMEAIQRQIAHYSYHVGQIVFLAKHLSGAQWQSLSIPKGNSQVFNAEKFEQDKQRKFFTQ